MCDESCLCRCYCPCKVGKSQLQGSTEAHQKDESGRRDNSLAWFECKVCAGGCVPDDHVKDVLNVVSSQKYNKYNFFFKALLLQFRRIGNVYFLLVTILMFLGLYTRLFQSSLTPWGQLLMLVLILSLNMISEGVDDLARYRSDKQNNNQTCKVLRANNSKEADNGAPNQGIEGDRDINLCEWDSIKWKELKSGHVLRIFRDQKVPADCLLLVPSHALVDPSAYIETSSIDGETYLKRRATLRPIIDAMLANGLTRLENGMLDMDADTVSQALKDASLHFAPPTPALASFPGSITLSEESEAGTGAIEFSANNVLLRGSVLRNTHSAILVVLHTGKNTKVLMADKGTPDKRSRVELLTNQVIATVLTLLAVLVFMSVLLYYVIDWPPSAQLWYMDFSSQTQDTILPTYISLIFQFIILYKNILPILLYGVQEGLAQLQSYYINNDIEMYCEETDKRAVCNTTNLTQEIGEIDWIFSDKTGTLTCNEMRFVGCSVANRMFGCVSAAQVEALGTLPNGTTPAETSKVALKDLNEYCSTEQGRTDTGVNRFLQALVLCHTVLVEAPQAQEGRLGANSSNSFFADPGGSLQTAEAPDPTTRVRKGDVVLKRNESTREFAMAHASSSTESSSSSSPSNKLVYNAESPDELALVEGAGVVGPYSFVASEGSSTVCIKVLDSLSTGQPAVIEKWQVLAVNPFSSTRKRMSILVREPVGERRILLLCKGADNQMLDSPAVGKAGFDLDETREQLDQFASAGLRTLVVAERIVSEEEFFKWKQSYDQACACLDPAEKKALQHEVACAIEIGLETLGVTCVEDRLQEDVADTIRLVRDSNIKLWVITGDKVETAINVGFSTRLLDERSILLSLTSSVAVGNEGTRASLSTADAVRDEITRYLAKESAEPNATENLALIVDGQVLSLFLVDSDQAGSLSDDHEGDDYGKERATMRADFLKLAQLCGVVVACRASPAQKAMLVNLVRKGVSPSPITLAIGDGSNDIPMIHAAHVGIGIQGKEGSHAVNASDFAIAKFRHLGPLLFVHGRLGYLRIAKAIGLIFYGNFLLAWGTFLFATVSMFSGAALFSDLLTTMFNYFVAAPVVILGAFDRDFEPVQRVLQHPRAYDVGRHNTLLTVFNYDIQMLRGAVHSSFAFLVLFFANVTASGQAISEQFYVFLVFLLTMREFLEASSISIPFIVVILGNGVGCVALVSILDLVGDSQSVLFKNYARNLWFSMISVLMFVAIFDLIVTSTWRSMKHYVPVFMDIGRTTRGRLESAIWNDVPLESTSISAFSASSERIDDDGESRLLMQELELASAVAVEIADPPRDEDSLKL